MLTQNQKETDGLSFIDMPNREWLGKLKSETPAAFYVRSTEMAEYSDYIERPAVFISDSVYRMVKKYDSTVKLGSAVFIDQNNGDQRLYWSLENMEGNSACISEESKRNKLEFITQLILDAREIPNQPLFRAVHGQQRFTIMRLDLAESLLRRGVCGFQLQPVAIVRGEH